VCVVLPAQERFSITTIDDDKEKRESDRWWMQDNKNALLYQGRRVNTSINLIIFQGTDPTMCIKAGTLLTVLLLLVARSEYVSAFVHRYGKIRSCSNALGRRFSNDAFAVTLVLRDALRNPTEEELASDDFMKQVSHSEKIVNMLQSDSDNVVELLKAQLGTFGWHKGVLCNLSYHRR